MRKLKYRVKLLPNKTLIKSLTNRIKKINKYTLTGKISMKANQAFLI